ncbi:MAG: hypothetical protein Q9171_004498 [Xanthocarpia ochracea]
MGNVEAIHLLLTNGADVNLRDSREETALHHAAFGAHTLAVEALLDAGARVDTESGIDMHTPLYSTLRDRQTIGPDQIQIIKLLLDRGADKDAPLTCYGPKLLGTAARLGSLELVQHLVEREAIFPHGILSYGLHDYNVAAYLLDRGAKILDRSDLDDAEVSAIVSAASFGNSRILQLLLSYANDVDVGASDEALPFAAYGGYLNVVDVLIDHGFDVNAHSCSYVYEESALMAACRANKPNSAVVRRLLELGADVLFRDSGGVHVAACQSDPETIGLLLDYGADTSSRDSIGNTPLVKAAHALCQSSVVCPYDEQSLMNDPPYRSFKTILDSTIEINAQGKGGLTALHALACGSLRIPAAHGTLEAARLLLTKGADIRIKCNRSCTAGDIFVKHDREGILREKATGNDPHRYCYMMLRPPPRS